MNYLESMYPEGEEKHLIGSWKSERHRQNLLTLWNIRPGTDDIIIIVKSTHRIYICQM